MGTIKNQEFWGRYLQKRVIIGCPCLSSPALKTPKCSQLKCGDSPLDKLWRAATICICSPASPAQPAQPSQPSQPSPAQPAQGRDRRRDIWFLLRTEQNKQIIILAEPLHCKIIKTPSLTWPKQRGIYSYGHVSSSHLHSLAIINNSNTGACFRGAAI